MTTLNENEQDELEEVEFIPEVPADDELVVTDSKAAETDIKSALDTIDDATGKVKKYHPDKPETSDERLMLKMKEYSQDDLVPTKEKSDGSTANYYELPENAKEIQHLISFKNMNGQMAEIFRAVYRYGEVEHSEKMRDAKKIKYYIEAEIERLEKYGE